MEELNWKEYLKAGDNVLVISNHDRPEIHKIQQVTKAQIVLDSSDRYSKATGELIGCSGNRYKFLKKATFEEMLEIREAAKKRSLINKLKNVNYSKLSLETLSSLNYILEEESQYANIIVRTNRTG